MMAMKVLSEDEAKRFMDQYNQSNDAPDKEIYLNKLADDWEQEFMLIGATAVEDKLQDRVPETIADLIKASNFYIVQIYFLPPFFLKKTSAFGC